MAVRLQPLLFGRSAIIRTQIKRDARIRAFSVRMNGLRGNHNSFNAGNFVILDEVRQAIQSKEPVVALESTIYTHGSHSVESLSLAMELEELVRANGAVPATCAVLDGVARVGLHQNELQQLLQRPNPMKISRRDLAFVTSLTRNGSRLSGGTTISGTMILANLAGIKVFATGGLGGVHRGGESSMDVSADLTELGRTPVAVISSGCKGFLDIPRTLEYLETQGVAVGTFADGRQGEVDFPAFWSLNSGVKSPFTIYSEEEAANAIYAQLSLNLSSGMLLANPVPAPYAIPEPELASVIEQTLQNAAKAGATGSKNTPFVLAGIKDLTQDRSTITNQALIRANIVRGAKVAVAFSRLQRQIASEETIQVIKQYEGSEVDDATSTTRKGGAFPASETTLSQNLNESSPALIVAGALAVDLSCDYKPATAAEVSPKMHTSNPFVMSESIGGVGHNIAKAAHLMGCAVQLRSAIGDDLAGKAALQTLKSLNMDTQGIKTFEASAGGRTARYISVHDAEKSLLFGLADMDILERPANDFERSWTTNLDTSTAQWLLVDANWDPPTLQKWIAYARSQNLKVAFEPVSVAKSARLFHPPALTTLSLFPNPLIDLCTPNTHELAAINAAAREGGLFEQDAWWRTIDALGISSAGLRHELVQATGAALVDVGVPQQSIQLLPLSPCIVTKLGAQGALLTMLLPADDERLRHPASAPHVLARSAGSDGVGGVYMRLFPPAERVPDADVVSVNGVGDTLVGVLMAQLASSDGVKVEDALELAQRASVLTLKSGEAVSAEVASLAGALRGARGTRRDSGVFLGR